MFVFKANIGERVVVPASGRLQPDGTFPDFYGGTYVGGHVRMRAAVQIAKLQPNSRFTMVGGYNRSGTPRIGDKVNDMARFMLDHVPDANVETVCSLPCTRHDMTATLNTWNGRNEPFSRVGVLTNDYHMGRTLHFANEAAAQIYGKNHGITFMPLRAEEILGESIEAIVGDDKMDQYYARLEIEEQGMQDIQNGDYNDSCLSKNPSDWAEVLERSSTVLLAPNEQDYSSWTPLGTL